MERLFFDLTTQKNQRWVSYQSEQWRQERIPYTLKKATYNPFITISREYGCHAFSLGKALAQQLNVSPSSVSIPWAVYDKKLLGKIESDYGIHQALLTSLTEKTTDEISDFLSSIIVGRPTQLFVYRKMFTTIRALAHQGHVILIGRGAPVVTRGLEGGFHIRLYAPVEWRVKEIMKMHNLIPEKEAHKMLRKVASEREMFVKKYLKANITDPSHYHIMLNNAESRIDEMVEIVVTALRNRSILKKKAVL